VKEYRAARSPGFNKWHIDICDGQAAVDRLKLRKHKERRGLPDADCYEVVLYCSKAEAEEMIKDLIWRDTDRGEHGAWHTSTVEN